MPADVERICSDTDLENFLDLTKGAYNPITLQVILERNGAPPPGQSPPPDPHPYFLEDHFPVSDVPHDPVTSDSDNELYLVQFGKKKPKSWPRADHGFEHEKSKVQKRIRRLQSYLAEVKDQYRKLLGVAYADDIDSDADDELKQ